ncbi:MAG: nickel/cobalt efflux protein RcnA [Stutzerimonas stutzeri]|nr:MAG: nickel/cobalt efflux protein RcnA [Stutzerimonas stutzeri]
MTPFSDLLQQGAAHAWLFIPSAILLGALHGLEPGHSKTMMAAFIVAIRGSVSQAILLGLSAAFSHTLVVWVVALVGLHYANSFDVKTSEPYFQLASAVIVIGVAAWMLWRTRQDQRAEHDHHHHDHDHHHDHGHHDHHHHGHDHSHQPSTAGQTAFQDAHERAHARDIERRFSGRAVTTWQIALFGLTGGLIPCPAAITVLLLCLQLKEFTLGATLVLCFSIGLAVVMVGVGVAAAIGMRHAEKRWSGAFDRVARRAPYFSAALIMIVGLYIGWSGWASLP